MKRRRTSPTKMPTDTIGFHFRRNRGSVVLPMEAKIGRSPTEMRRGFMGSFSSSLVKPGEAGMEDGGLEGPTKKKDTFNHLQGRPLV